jgi:hypothetical protein
VLLAVTDMKQKYVLANVIGSTVLRASRLPIKLSKIPHFQSFSFKGNNLETYRPPRPVTGIALLYGDGVCFL